jgi:putative FmdB family regulatory protein
MPTYDYHCETCGNNFEYFQSISSEKLTVCPENSCVRTSGIKGTGTVVRKISGGAGLVFHGSGFYGTDYVQKSSEKVEKNESSSASDTTSDSTTASPPTTSSASDSTPSKPPSPTVQSPSSTNVSTSAAPQKAE